MSSKTRPSCALHSFNKTISSTNIFQKANKNNKPTKWANAKYWKEKMLGAGFFATNWRSQIFAFPCSLFWISSSKWVPNSRRRENRRRNWIRKRKDQSEGTIAFELNEFLGAISRTIFKPAKHFKNWTLKSVTMLVPLVNLQTMKGDKNLKTFRSEFSFRPNYFLTSCSLLLLALKKATARNYICKRSQNNEFQCQ